MSSTFQISLSDINELACEIGKECEKLIANFGHENTNEIVTKCITALEMLENMSNEREKSINEIQDLQEKILQLEKVKTEKTENQKAFEKDLESIEEIWTAEVEGLRSKIKKLQEDNRKLIDTQNKLIRSTSKSPENSLENLAGTLYAEEYKLNERLKEQIKLYEKEIEVKDLEIRDLNAEIEELKMAINQMRRQSRVMESQVKTLYEEREEILAEMNDQHKSFIVLRDHLGIAQLENEDLAWRKLNDSERPRFTMSEMSKIFTEKSALAEKVAKLEKELEKFKNEKTKIENGTKIKEMMKKNVSANRQNYPQLWRKLVLESMLASPLYETPI
ncbi:hypothetical protein PVAND_014667 [Polypedilum vanderplanki]|uniref:RH1 domain-containing protein n=1 Tax=Polypedilum vanderplanki TaxID=319348 RepID=A0A9J6BAV3_POLVA|nr:hypothetical protein PVAND_014667 [Polypedilum vanderplanki]